MIYMDNAATTKMAAEVADKMHVYMTKYFGNPSSLYGFASKSKEAVSKSREEIAKLLNCDKEEIFFTCGGSESDNWALKGVCSNLRKGHIITSKIEHHAILNSALALEKEGFTFTFLDVDENGIVSPEDVEKEIREDTILVSIMYANNEIGSIEPIKEIGDVCSKHGILFHTDAVQAVGQIPIDLSKINVDLLSGSGHKFNGPKGTGFLFVREGVKIDSLINGGAQENGLRAGTENVPGIVGIGEAAKIARENLTKKIAYEKEIRDYLIERIEREIPFAFLNGPRINRLPGNVNFSFKFIEGEGLLLFLDMKGVCASSGSACQAGSEGASHVLLAIGRDEVLAQGSVRLSISHETTMEEADSVVEILKESVQKLRDISPLYSDYKIYKRRESY